MLNFIKKMTENHNMIFNFFDSVHDLVFLMQKDGYDIRYMYINKTAKELLNIEEDIIGKKLEDVLGIEQSKELIEKYHETFDKRETVRIEQRLVTKDGDVFIGESSLNPFIETNGECHYVISIVRNITDLRREQKNLAEMAFKDYLTGLHNRRSFDDQLTDAITKSFENNTKVAVLMLDGKEFKLINDTYGHAAGDAVIQEFGRRIQNSVRKEDIVGRLGGDEFGVILPNLSLPELAATTIAKRIVEAMKHPFFYNGQEIMFGCGIGIAIYPDHAISKRKLLGYADDALYEAKEKYGNGYKLFSFDMEKPQVS